MKPKRRKPELLPCPFCGGKAELADTFARVAPSRLPIMWSVLCDSDDCSAEVFAVSRTGTKAARKWNRRAKGTVVKKKGLASCPFCGGSARKRKEGTEILSDPLWVVECTECLALVIDTADSDVQVIAQWNRRENES